jgi:hypothetical protein
MQPNGVLPGEDERELVENATEAFGYLQADYGMSPQVVADLIKLSLSIDLLLPMESKQVGREEEKRLFSG